MPERNGHPPVRIEEDRTVSRDAMRAIPVAPGTPASADLLTEDFGELIDMYTRAEAIADGLLVEVPAELASEAGFRYPMVLTAAAWEDCVDWPESERAAQDETGRLRDVLTMARHAVRRSSGGARRVRITVMRVPRGGSAPNEAALEFVVGPGDTPEPVITIQQPGED